MEDYFCIIKNVKSARLYIEYLNKKFEGEDIKISFVQEDYDLYESYSIEDYGLRFGVKIIPSILFKSKENILIVAFNPKNSPSKPAISMLESVKTERTYRIINILYGLTDKFSINISPKQVIEKLDKTELSDLYLISDDDIMELIVENGYCESIQEANVEFFKKVNLPRLVLPYEKLIKKLSLESELYIVDPNNFINSRHSLNHIKGFILNYKYINKNIKEICLQNNLDIRFGSGKLID